MKKKTPIFLLLAAGALLVSCGDNGQPGSSSTLPDVGGDETTSSTPAGPVESTYKIVIKAVNGVEITPDKTEAKKGEKVTLVVATQEGFTLKALLLNGKEGLIEKESETVYSFLMLDTSAVITAKVEASGECVVSGEVAAVLNKQSDGTYRGKVTVENEAKVDIMLGETRYTFLDIDHNHSFGYYEAPSVGGASFSLAGNAIYEITVNPSSLKPVTIYRVGVLHAPTSVNELESLFNGDFAGRGVLDGGAFYLRDLNRVTYKNALSGDTYEWDLYENNVSLGTSVDTLGETSYVYRALKDDQYVVLDTYLEAKKAGDGDYYDDSVRTDTKAYSATYGVEDIVDEDTDLLKRYKRERAYAECEVALPSHNMYGISREIAKGYRYGFEVADDLVASRVSVTSTDLGEEGFRVEVSSWKNYDPAGSTVTEALKVERYEYTIALEFNADTSLKKGEYVGKYYDETNWNFDRADANNGGTAKPNTKPDVRRKMNFEYGYGAPKQGAPEIDLTPYFTQSVSNVSFTSPTMEKNTLQLGATVDEARHATQASAEEDSMSGYVSLMKADFAPATALDTWQYGVTASSDTKVVGLDDTGRYCWKAKTKGTATLEIGNHIGKKVATCDVRVGNTVKVAGYFVSAPSALGGIDSPYIVSSSHVKMHAGEKIDLYLWASPTNCDPAPTVVSSDPELLVSVSKELVKPDVWNITGYPTKMLTLDARNIQLDATKVITLTITDPLMDTDRISKSTVQVTLEPGVEAGVWPESVVGTTWTGNKELTDLKAEEAGWKGESVHTESSITFTDEDYVYNGAVVEGYKKMRLTATYSGQTRNFELGYVYDPSSPTLIKFKSGYYMDDVYYAVDKTAGGFGLTFVQSTWLGQDQGDIDYVVGFPEDETSPMTHQWFTLS